MFQEVKHKFLRQIVRFTFRVPAPANELAQRRPIAPAQFLKSLPRWGFIIQRGSGEQTPMCCRKVHPVFLTKQILVPNRAMDKVGARVCDPQQAVPVIAAFGGIRPVFLQIPMLRVTDQRSDADFVRGPGSPNAHGTNSLPSAVQASWQKSFPVSSPTSCPHLRSRTLTLTLTPTRGPFIFMLVGERPASNL